MEDKARRNRILAIIVVVITAAVIVSTMLFVLQMKLPEDKIPPSKVRGLEIYDLHDGKLFLFWDEATDNKKVERYQIIRDGNLLPTEPSYPFYVDTALVDGRIYFYKVRAVDSFGNVGDPSDPVSGMPTPSDNVPPNRVEGLNVENAFNGKLNLTWEQAFDNVAVAKYRIYRDGTKLEEEPTVTFYQDTGLTDGQNYTYEVSAVDTAGNEGQKSRPVSGKPTLSVPEVTISGFSEGANSYNITVDYISEAVDIGLFGVLLKIDSNETDRMGPLVSEATEGNITFFDTDSDGLLTVGDSFVISVTSGHDYQFSIYWQSTEQLIDTDEWAVP